MKSYLFAYGTLQSGANLNFFEENDLGQYLKVVGKGTVSGDLLHLRNNKQEMDYPGLVNAGQSNGKVHGTLFEVSDEEKAFPLMDKHEGYVPNLSTEESRQKNYYERVRIMASFDHGGKEVPVTVYILNRNSEYFRSGLIEERGIITSGDWLKYMQQLPS